MVLRCRGPRKESYLHHFHASGSSGTEGGRGVGLGILKVGRVKSTAAADWLLNRWLRMPAECVTVWLTRLCLSRIWSDLLSLPLASFELVAITLNHLDSGVQQIAKIQEIPLRERGREREIYSAFFFFFFVFFFPPGLFKNHSGNSSRSSKN